MLETYRGMFGRNKSLLKHNDIVLSSRAPEGLPTDTSMQQLLFRRMQNIAAILYE